MLTLSIDDQKTATDMMTYMLNKIDPDGTHLAANSVSEALTMLSDDVQIVFLDIEMPGLNGIQLAEKIRRAYDGINVIFVTGHPEYDRMTLDKEYRRDRGKGLDTAIPVNYYPDDDPDNKPLLHWRSHANNLYTNWLNYYVYQLTPYDIG